jgi:hypothetical protein
MTYADIDRKRFRLFARTARPSIRALRRRPIRDDLIFIDEMIGSGAVYVVDGHDLSYTNISEVSFNRAMSVFGDSFNIHSRHPAHTRADVEYLDAESQLLTDAAPSEVAKL